MLSPPTWMTSPLFSLFFFRFCILHCVLSLALLPPVLAWIQYPPAGIATMTHYTLPKNYIAACGCTATSTHYPTAAMSQMAFGSSTAYGPGCGRCFRLTLLNSVTSSPLFFPTVKKSIVVKITDLCPAGGRWCSATETKPNSAGSDINFDLAWPSVAIPNDFFPSNASFYGYTDFGVWNVTYEAVDCLQEWAGAKQRAALGSVDNGSSVCCPANPTGSPNDTCPSFSDKNGIPPDTHTTNSAVSVVLVGLSSTAHFVLSLCISLALI